MPSARTTVAHAHHACCWVCGNSAATLVREGVKAADLQPQHFAITDASYGTTLSIVQCDACGYLFCPDADNVTAFYMALEDEEYERTRAERALQARHLMKHIARHQPAGTLLDIGAGSGILVSEAAKQGFTAEGVEPSAWLVRKAEAHGLAVSEGVFPQVGGDTRYDVITLIDVIEHVTTPRAMLQDIAAHLEPEGIAVIVTPDVGSLAARLMGRKWWHYRIAHVSYFNKKTLRLALENAGLTATHWYRPSWVFPLDYLVMRLAHYVPFLARLGVPRFTQRITIPLNLRDSWLVIARKTV